MNKGLQFLLAIFLLFIRAFWEGLVFMKIYEWCLMPLCTALPYISYPKFVLLNAGISALRIKTSAQRETYSLDKPETWIKVVTVWLNSMFIFIFLWIMHNILGG